MYTVTVYPDGFQDERKDGLAGLGLVEAGDLVVLVRKSMSHAKPLSR
jgi:hypothetical protein